MTDRRLQVFHAVARYLSFTRAAEALMMTQPAVTLQIKQLEERYNARLFERSPGRVSLTPAGELVLEHAERILAGYAELETRMAEMTGEPCGPLLIGASTTIAEFLLPRVLGEFNALYPRVRARLEVANSDAIASRIVERTIDVGLLDLPQQPAGLEAETCCEDELVVICAPDYPLAGLQEVDPATLTEYEFISREPGSGTRQVSDAYFRARGIAPETLKTLMELGSPEALKGVVATGLGFAILPRVAIGKEQALGTLVAVPLNPPLRRPLTLVYPREKYRARTITNFVTFARRRLAELAGA